MGSLEIVVYGSPKALKRHRSYRVGNHIKSYDPSSRDKSDFIAQIINSRPAMPLDCKLVMAFAFYMPLPKSMPKKLQNIIRDGQELPHCKKPDLDNMIKFCIDAMNGIIYRDDRSIYKISAVKLYGETPRTVINIWW